MVFIMIEKNEIEYLKKSKEFAIKQLLEKWKFEIDINKKLFNKEISLNDLISDSHSVICLSYDEYKEIYIKIIED